MAVFPVVASPAPILQFLDTTGKPLVGGLLFTYLGGTTTKTPTYTDATGTTQNTNPIVLDLFGAAPSAIFVPPNTAIKFVLAPAGSSDPPTNPLWTVDNVAAATTGTGSMALQDAGNVAITGGTAILGSLTCTGGTQLSAAQITGNADLDANLDVAGTSAFGGTATFSSPVTINANLKVNGSFLSFGSSTGTASLQVQANSSGFAAIVALQTGASNRWAIYKDLTSESGGDTGSNFRIDAYHDNGNVSINAMLINRVTGLVTIQSLQIFTNGGLTLVGQTTGAASGTGTLTNAPHSANPGFWLPVTINGSSFFIPCWAA